jgi:prepilin-type N-terminal cleavage/methylation domain-containing protein/prepilin-type processing-associated H-X9-DG protein
VRRQQLSIPYHEPSGVRTSLPLLLVPHQSALRAFTLVELLTTISIIAILACVSLPALTNAKARVRSTQCSSNQKQFALALLLYGGDYQDSVLPNKDGANVARGETWVQGWLGVSGKDCTNTALLKQSLVGPYTRDTAIWRCPSSPAYVLEGNLRMPRVRTVSLNIFIGAPVPAGGAPAPVYARLSDFIRPGPAKTFTFMDERADTINDGSFALQWDFSPQHPDNWALRDKPTGAHQGRAIIAFADGHIEPRRWIDRRTLAAPRDDAVMAGNRDILWLQERATWRQP